LLFLSLTFAGVHTIAFFRMDYYDQTLLLDNQARSHDFANADRYPWVPAKLSSYLYFLSPPLKVFFSPVA